MENAKHEYDVVIDSKNELENYLNAMKSENGALKLELEEKYKALDICLNENATLKGPTSKKEKYTNYMHANRQFRKKHAHSTCYECGRKCHIAFYYFYKKKHSPF